MAGVLTVTAPAAADTVGDGQVVTDPTSETEGDPPSDPAPVAVHTAAQPAASAPAPRPPSPASPVTTQPIATTTTQPAAAATPAAPPARKTLPFTGVNAVPLALIGLTLLGAGSGLLAVLRQPVE
jgi:hypothetical protein